MPKHDDRIAWLACAAHQQQFGSEHCVHVSGILAAHLGKFTEMPHKMCKLAK